jgi:hypothetical protein
MEKTSRRDFAKTMSAALAAVPALLVTNACAGGQSSSEGTKSGTSTQSILHHQDTPPELQIMDGSLIIESSEEFTETTGTRNLYKSMTKTFIHQIKVLGDSGEKIYEDRYANDGTTSSSIEIVWINEDKNATGNVIITGGGSVFQIDSDKKLDKDTQKKRRKFKYDHKGPGGGKRIRIESIEITNARGLKTRFTATPTGTADAFLPDEFRMLIWRE